MGKPFSEIDHKHCQMDIYSLHWRHNGRDGVSNHQPPDCFLNCLFRHKPKKTSKLRATGLCEGNSPVTGELPAQRVSNAENASIWWRHHVLGFYWLTVIHLTTRNPFSNMVHLSLIPASMQSHTQESLVWNYFSILKTSTVKLLKLGNGQVISTHTFNGWKNLSVLGLKLIHVSNRGSDPVKFRGREEWPYNCTIVIWQLPLKNDRNVVLLFQENTFEKCRPFCSGCNDNGK